MSLEQAITILKQRKYDLESTKIEDKINSALESSIKSLEIVESQFKKKLLPKSRKNITVPFDFFGVEAKFFVNGKNKTRT